MSGSRPRRVYAGERLRRLRQVQGVTQAALAASVGLSASYFNQIEQDQRPLPDRVIRELCARFSLDPGYFGTGEELHLAGALREAVSDPLFGGAAVDLAEIQAMIRAAPGMAQRFMTLYRQTIERAQQTAAAPRPHVEPGITQAPYDEVREWVQARHNHFAVLDAAAERVARRLGLGPAALRAGLARHLLEAHGISIAEAPGLLKQGLVWRFDTVGRQLLLAEEASPESRIFWTAHQLGLIEQRRAMDRLIEASGLSTGQARALARVSLANYYAGAVMMPYGEFLRAAEADRYDIQLLQSRFGASFEQVCHRLSTMQRQGAPGVPFYFVKSDISGNVLKRSSATGFQFTQFGGSCPLWNLYRAFARPGQISVQIARTPDDATYLNIACTVGRPASHYLSRPRAVAVVLGCDIRHAPRLVYATGLDIEHLETADPIGPGCRVCSRTLCRHRAMPALGQALDIATSERGVLPYRVREAIATDRD